MFARGLLNAIVGSSLCPRRARRVLLQLWGLDVQTSGILERSYFGGGQIHIGARSTVNVGCIFDNGAPIWIGDDCQIGIGVQFITSSHEIGGPERRGGPGFSNAIRVDDGCWIGSRATILEGVVIGAGCIVAAGSLVREDCEPNGLYVGVPARRSRELHR